MNKVFNLRLAYHEMLRTKCINIYLIILGHHFQLGLYREYASTIKGAFLGLVIAPHLPFKPYRFSFFIPSFYTIDQVFKQWIRVDGGYCLSKRIKFSVSLFKYYRKNC